MSFRSTVLLLLLSGFLLAGCDSAEERADKHYRAAVELAESGDVDRAIVEFRNVFDLVETHRPARKAYAALLRQNGRIGDAYAQYLQLVEQYPDDMDGLTALSEMSVAAGNWEDARRYIAKALEIEPANVPVRIAEVMADYTAAINAGDDAAAEAVVARIPELRAARPDDITLRRVLITDFLRRKEYDKALDEVNLAIEQSPKDQSLYALRLAIYMQHGDVDAVDAELATLTRLFPDDPGVTAAVVQWYEERGAPERAEAFLRERADARKKDSAALSELLRFLVEKRGLDAALDELNRRIADEGETTFLRAAMASLQFDNGRHEEGLAALRDAIAKAGPNEDVTSYQLALAHMLKAVGEDAEMRTIVDDILARDPGETEAMKLKAGALIADDRTNDAISMLRHALDLAPQDAGAMTLLSQAHLRDGDRDLARQFLSMAVRAAGAAPAESLRYARFLMDEGDNLAAESVLITALKRTHDDPDLLTELGGVYVALADWPRAGDVARALEHAATPEARARAVPLRMAIFKAQGEETQARDYLGTLPAEGAPARQAQIALIQSQIDAGQPAEAVASADKLLATAPDDPELRYVAAVARERAGDLPAAAAAYQAMIDAGQSDPQVWTGLARVQSLMPGQIDAAAATLDKALAAYPGSPGLLWARASVHELQGEYDAAIAIYEDIYTRDSSSDIAANNLASLLSTQRADDPDALARARVVARRLRGSTEAPFQDTYGWIAYLSGDYQTALKELQSAVAVLGDDPQVRYHLAATYQALGEIRAAREQYEKVADIVAPDDTRDFVVKTRAFLSAADDAAKNDNKP